MNLEEINQLKKDIETTNNRLLVVKTQIETAKQRQSEILKEYNCNTVEELESLKKQKETEMANLVQQANLYLNTVLPIVAEAENLTRVI